MIFVTDASGRATYVGPEWKDMTGQSLADAVNFGWAAVVHPDDREFVRGLVLDAIRQQSGFNVRYRLLLQTGGFVWIAAGAVPSYGPPGRTFLGFLGSITQLAENTTQTVTTDGSLERFQPVVLPQNGEPASVLELAADHLIVAHALLTQDGRRSALSAVETALHHVGVALAKAAQGDVDAAGPLH